MNKNIIIVILTLLLIGGGIYYKNLQNKPVPVAIDGHTDHSHDGEAITADTDHTMSIAGEHMLTGAKLAGTRTIIKNPAIKSGSQVLSFEIYGKDGDAWGDEDLKIAHEKKMHFIIVSSDFSDYQHVHPQYKDKLWQVKVTFRNNTTYQAYVDIDSNEDGPEVLRIPVAVGTPQVVSKISQKETTLSKGGIDVTMSAENGFSAGKENSVIFTLSKGGKIIIPENYLGAKGHVVALGDDPNTFIHGHPDDHGDSEIHFAFSFEKSGTYTLFAQFQVNGVVGTYPFTINVIDGNTSISSPLDESKPHEHTVPHN